MKRGNVCHGNMWQVMGNSSSVGFQPMSVTFGGAKFLVHPTCFKKDGTLKKSAARELKKLEAMSLLATVA